MVVRLDSAQPVFPLPPLDEIPDVEEDIPKPGLTPTEIGSLKLPEIVFGAASFSHQYNSEGHIRSYTPLRTVRLALRYGVRAFDTSAYYGPSEIILGTALKALEPDFPRSSYKLMTKCGRYGAKQEDFDYSPLTIRASVQRSLSRFTTEYLDTVYLHDAEFVCTQVGLNVPGDPTLALTEKAAEYGLAEGQEGKIWGAGDQKILDAVAELRKMKMEGLIKSVGITGYPLPTLLRIALLVLHNPPYQPLDVLLSYSHLTLQNSTFAEFLPHFRDRARIPQLLTASPLNMGLLTPNPPPWHPAPTELKNAARTANAMCKDAGWEGGLPNVAIGYGYEAGAALNVPVVVGISNLREVHENVRVWREIKEGKQDAKRKEVETKILDQFADFKGWSWASP
ncbi:hypothetical protein CERSUDRAFT_131452 [Gelatoporia subvermispora B]|uniref:NADP-dependent oxidoreductase domain-containing protein n=1 Tax=Ceriporiopsis subvermispora (strain B) TaxID=914234 RepID=M2PW36_CERS8|nr:hypothetical protein CERSUDRAFT_131452 [Gelatoporia subvermispora B]